MATYVAMLRGINVGGHNRIKMPVLEALFVGLGHTDVVTYIQSGNVVFKSRSKSAAAVVRGIEEAHHARARPRRRGPAPDRATSWRPSWRPIPFLRSGADPARLHVTFLDDDPRRRARAASWRCSTPAPTRSASRGRDVYLHCPEGYGNTKLNNGFVEKRLQAIATTRNWNSVTKLLELSD